MKNYLKLPVLGFIAAISSSIMVSGCIIHVGANDLEGGYSFDSETWDSGVSEDESGKRTYSSTNKSIKVGEGKSVGDISSVNGSVKVEDGVSASEVSNVNGRIDIGNNVSVRNVDLVNGRIRIGEDFRSTGSIESVNGEITIDAGGNVGGSVETVNGDIVLKQVDVATNVSTVNGDIDLRNGSVVRGDVVFSGKPNNNSWRQNPPKLSVDASSVIEGNIIVEKEVEFDFDDESLMDKVIRR
ncbi:hypothetical protein PN836_014275 [Ningiella sp. W23]|uniref:hypothetical protein n=1 Tax=Ningiella sp. W23 TaxID=3023715 RepID=UPI003758111D